MSNHPFVFTNLLTAVHLTLVFAHVWIMAIAHRRLKIKIIGQLVYRVSNLQTANIGVVNIGMFKLNVP